MNFHQKLPVILGIMVVIMIISTGCTNSREPLELNTNDYTIIVYGTSTCGFTTSCMTSLDNEELVYTFKDVSMSTTFNSEMWSKIQEADLGTTAYYPVVDVNDTILMRPTLTEIKSHL